MFPLYSIYYFSVKANLGTSGMCGVEPIASNKKGQLWLSFVSFVSFSSVAFSAACGFGVAFGLLGWLGAIGKVIKISLQACAEIAGLFKCGLGFVFVAVDCDDTHVFGTEIADA